MQVDAFFLGMGKNDFPLIEFAEIEMKIIVIDIPVVINGCAGIGMGIFAVSADIHGKKINGVYLLIG